MLSVRLDPATARALARLARRTGRSRSAVVRDAIRRLSEGAGDEPAAKTIYDRLAPLLGTVTLGPEAAGELVTTWPVVTEAMYLLSGAPGAPARVLNLLATGAVRLAPLDAADVSALRRLMHRYASLPIDVADASVVRVAERDGIFDVFTLDRNFRVYRIAQIQAFAIIP